MNENENEKVTRSNQQENGENKEVLSNEEVQPNKTLPTDSIEETPTPSKAETSSETANETTAKEADQTKAANKEAAESTDTISKEAAEITPDEKTTSQEVATKEDPLPSTAEAVEPPTTEAETEEVFAEENLSRVARHQAALGEKERKPKSGRFGKNIFTLVSIIVVVAVASGAYLFYDHEHQAAINQEQYENGAKNLLADIQEERDQSGVVNTKQAKSSKTLQTVIYNPDNSKGNLPFENPQSELQNLVAKAKKKVKDQKAVVVGKLNVDMVSDQLDIYQLVAQPYRWNPEKEEFMKEKPITGDTQYIFHKTGKPVTIADLIPEEADLLGIQQVIQQQILDEAKDKKAIFDQVLDLPVLTMKDKIVYTPEELVITLPKNDTGTKEITLQYKDIAAFINTSLVDSKKLQDPDKVTLDPNKKYVALTFDDGPNAATTGRLLDVLKEKKATATFFLLGENVKGNEDLVKRMVDEGMDVGSHSYDHPLMTNLSDDQIKAEIRKTDEAIFNASGQLPKNLRTPYGAANQRVAHLAGKPLIHWSVDSQDWEYKNAAKTIQRIKDTLYEGSIVLMHDIHESTVEALPQVIDNMRQEGYEFVSVDTLLQQTQKPLYTYFGENDFRMIE